MAMKMRQTLTLMTCIAMLLIVGCPLGTPSDHYRPHGHQDTTIDIAPTDDAILFNATGTGGRDLYLLRINTLNVVRITDSPNYEVTPSFSPDAKRIVYAAGVPGDRADHIFTIGVDGKLPVQLTDRDANDTAPRFSPDGSQIAFARDKTYIWGGLAANWENGGVICVINSDGTGELQLTSDDLYAHTPSFSTDGKSVIYFTADGQFAIPSDGSSDATRIGPPASYVDYSGDGKRLLFSDGKYSPDYEIFVSDIDGSNRSQITKSSNGCFHGTFSGNGDKIYFLMEEWPEGATGHPKSSIWEVNADGTGQRQITNPSLFDNPMRWKPQESP
jgi:Tol biopolymer transport system component